MILIASWNNGGVLKRKLFHEVTMKVAQWTNVVTRCLQLHKHTARRVKPRTKLALPEIILCLCSENPSDSFTVNGIIALHHRSAWHGSSDLRITKKKYFLLEIAADKSKPKSFTVDYTGRSCKPIFAMNHDCLVWSNTCKIQTPGGVRILILTLWDSCGASRLLRAQEPSHEKHFVKRANMHDIKSNWDSLEHKYFGSGCHYQLGRTQLLLINQKVFFSYSFASTRWETVALRNRGHGTRWLPLWFFGDCKF